MTVEVRVLGPLEIVGERGRLVGSGFASKKARRLFEVLVLADGQAVSKDALLEALWRRELPRNPQATVETAASLARKALATVTDERVIVTESAGYRIDPTTVDVDLARLERAIAESGDAPRSHRVALLAAGLAEVRGRLLDDEFATDWLLPRRERVARRVDLARVLLATSALEAGEYQLAYATAEASWTSSDVVLEDAYAIGALALGAQGRRAEADGVLSMAVERLARHGTPPGPVLDAARARLQRPFSAVVPDRVLRVPDELVRDAASLPGQLPMLGRAAERTHITAAAAAVAAGEGPRWLHLDGGLGMGATRLLEESVEWTSSSMGVGSAVMLVCSHGDSVHEGLLVRRALRALDRRGGGGGGPVSAAGDLFDSFAGATDRAGLTVLTVDGLEHADAPSVALLRAATGPGGVDGLLVLSAGGTPPAGASPLPLTPLTADDLAPLGGGPWLAVTGGVPAVLRVAFGAARGGGMVDARGSMDLGGLLDALDPVSRAGVGRTEYNSGLIRVSDVCTALRIEASTARAALHRVVVAGLADAVDHDTVRMTSLLLRSIAAG